MKKIKYINICLVCSLLFLFSGCTNDREIDSSGVIEEGVSVSLDLPIGANTNNIIESRAGDDGFEDAIRNLYVLTFDSKGVKVAGQYLPTFTTESNVTLQTVSGKGMMIYGVANLDPNLMDLNVSLLNRIETLADLIHLTPSLMQLSDSRGLSLLMAGYLKLTPDAIEPLKVDIPSKGEANLGASKIYLSKLDAKIKFEIKTDLTEGITDLKFAPKEWRVVNLPIDAKLYPYDGYYLPTEVFTTSPKPFDNEATNGGKMTFSFYMLESKQAPQVLIMPANPLLDFKQQYGLRAKKRMVSRDFINAPLRAPYVEMSGRVSYMDRGNSVSGDVVYTVILGHTSADDRPSVDNYNITRNTSYTFNVKIQSVNDIIVEVDSGKELDAGAIGDVILTKSKTTIFDSHYGAETIEFTIADLSAPQTTKGKFKWGVVTPYESVSHMPGDDSKLPKDYKWIYFKLNQGTGSYLTELATFPGVKNIYVPSENALNTIANDPMSDALVLEYLANSDKLVDIDNLLKVINSSIQVSGGVGSSNLLTKGGKILFTAFVDEYHYYTNPVTGANNQDLWKTFVNENDRLMHIIINSRTSADNESSILETGIMTFRQNSIQSVYPKLSDIKEAWGSETSYGKRAIFETSVQQSQFPVVMRPKSKSNGLVNTKTNLGISTAWNLKWRDYVDPNTGDMRDAFSGARYACLSRNRDLNGNGILDASEFRWYLAAINQLTDLWIGENSISVGAKLWTNNKDISDIKESTGWGEEIYMSSTSDPNNAVSLVLWSSEGSSIGKNYLTGSKLSYRCVRDLGKSTQYNGEYEDIASYSGGGMAGNWGEIRVDGLDYKSVRDLYTTDELKPHHERELTNLPYRGFRFYHENTGGDTPSTWWDLMERRLLPDGSVGRTCPSGWRMPNQREVSLMFSRIPNISTFGYELLISCTSFSQFSEANQRTSFAFNNNVVKLLNGGNRGYVRCVQDIH